MNQKGYATPEQMARAIALSAKVGVARAAKRCGVTRSALYARLKREKEKAPRASIDPRPATAAELLEPPFTKDERTAMISDVYGIGRDNLPLIVRRYESTIRNMIDVGERAGHWMRQYFDADKDKRDLLAVVALLTLDNYQLKHGRKDTDCVNLAMVAGQQST